MTEETKFKLFCASNDNTYSKLPAQYGLIARNLYKDGADWYRNNVWHDASEDVGTNEPILVLDEEGRGCTTTRERLVRGYGEWGKGFCRWAYVEDLLPDNYINKGERSMNEEIIINEETAKKLDEERQEFVNRITSRLNI